jgi:hypothetical protein
MRIPSDVVHIDELPSWVPQEAKWLVGYWFNDNIERPAVSRSNWSRMPRYASKHWSETVKLRIASQLPKISHWKIIQGSWHRAVEGPNITYFVDPPYSASSGKSYRFNNSQIDYIALGKWCRTRHKDSQVIACEQDGASWLPFDNPYALIISRRRTLTAEVVWTSG